VLAYKPPRIFCDVVTVPVDERDFRAAAAAAFDPDRVSEVQRDLLVADVVCKLDPMRCHGRLLAVV